MTLIFQHIPKTAGRTLESVLERRYARSEIFDIDRSKNVRESAFAALPLDDRARIRLIKGHMNFGIHQHVPNPFTYITILRNPTERVVSHYYFVRRSPSHRLHSRVVSSNMTLEEYVTSGIALELNDGQVRGLVGPDHLRVGFGQCSREMLEKAQSHLESYFSVVGLTERFDETLVLMRRELGWKQWPLYRSRNVSKSRPRLAGVRHDVLKRIEDLNAFDIELYERVRDSFDRRFANDDLNEELIRFRARNRVLGPYTALAGVPRSFQRRFMLSRRPSPPYA